MIIISTFSSVHAEGEEDMSKWSFKILLQHADQLDELKVVKFKNKESGRFGFCLQAEVDYDPKNSIYTKEDLPDEEIFKIVKAFEMLGEDYYIAAQLMIWEKCSGIRYSFDGLDAADYGEGEILAKIASFEDEKDDIEELDIDISRNSEARIALKDADSMDIVSSDVQIISIDDKGVVIKVNDENEDEYKIELISRYKESDGSYIYRSETSQDLYSYEGNYLKQKKVTIDLHVKQDLFNLVYRKLDENNQPLSGSEYKLYQIDQEGTDEFMAMPVDYELDLFSIVNDDFNVENVKLKVSERYEKYLNGTIINPKEAGYFDYELTSGSYCQKGRVYVTDNDEIDGLTVYPIKEVGTYISQYTSENVIYGLEKDASYILCESKPKNGYVFGSDPFVLIDGNTFTDVIYTFINTQRHYDLRLYKENEDHSILLNGARFKLTYEDEGEIKEKIFVSGALCIQQKNDKQYVLYRHENDENIYVGEFSDGYFIKDKMIPGKYFYLQTDEVNINDSSLLNKEITVIDGGFEIKDIPYASKITVEELEAPKGYYIEEAVFEITADLDYSQIIYRNYRVNTFDMMPGNKFKVPKTCIGN